ncbi:MAG TPA: RHS repeat-associated core domain-containing protein, partial [Pyrinomonadaceae bacterium]|nr:RHS repeat-associated core domain-containing protein [Pyrinomonadaceae bacterium]
PTTNLLIQQYQTISSTTEAYLAQVLDGAGRVRGVATDHTFSGTSTASYSGQDFKYDIMGRLWKRSNPTEFIPNATTGTWDAAGDDLSVGWRYTTRTYDWQDRPLVTTNPDSSTRTNSYAGCGCAGGEQVTTADERGRKKVYYKDVQGRLAKVEELLLSGVVYRTTTYTYDTLDHLTQINQGGQLRTFDYDGHGRLTSRTTPEQGTTTYVYNKDDTVQKVTDARSVTTTFGYNARHLPTAVSYTLPTGGGGVVATPNLTFAYDAAGNRTSMTEKNSAGTVVGSSVYHYDSLARMDWEERFFQGVGTYRLSYEYNIGGELTSLTAPSQFGSFEIGYTYDRTGRTTAVTGSGYGGVSSYVNSIAYRAFGAAKQIAYGNTKTLSMTYDTRLRLTGWSVPGTGLRWTYAYSTPNIPEKTGRVAFANNLDDGTLDRSYAYDDLGQLGAAHSGNEANGHAGYTSWPTAPPNGPYAANYTFDQFGNMIWRNGWGVANAQYAYNPQFAGNKMTVNPVTGAAVGYDLAGNLTNDGMQTYTYYATGQQATASGSGLTQTYDGDGLRVKKTENGVTTCYLRSTMLGKQVVLEITGSAPVGQMVRGYVFLGGQMLAVQQGDQVDGVVNWVHQDPVTKSQRLTSGTGAVVSTIDVDPWGGETARSSNQSQQPRRFTNYERDANGGDEAMFRRYESKWARFAQPDPYDGSYNQADPLSLNRYAYVHNDPVNFVDPTGLYEACVHEAMTNFLAKLAKYSDKVAAELGRFAGDKPGGADSKKYAATSFINIIKGFFGKGPSADIHFASKSKLEKEISRFDGYIAAGNFQRAGFVLHSIQDVHGAHQGYGLPFGHFFSGHKPDRIIGDSKFMRAANETYQVLTGNKSATLSAQQMDDLINAIIAGCGAKAGELQIVHHLPIFARGGGGRAFYGGGGFGWRGGGFDWFGYMIWFYMMHKEPEPPSRELA